MLGKYWLQMTLRWGIVTAGKISNDFVNAFNTYPEKGDQAIVAVAARDKNRATEFAKIHNISKVFDTYQALAISSDIGKDLICTLKNVPVATVALRVGYTNHSLLGIVAWQIVVVVSFV